MQEGKEGWSHWRKSLGDEQHGVATCYSSQGSETQGMPLEEREANEDPVEAPGKNCKHLCTSFYLWRLHFINHRVFQDLPERHVWVLWEQNSTQALVTVLRVESSPPSCRAKTSTGAPCKAPEPYPNFREIKQECFSDPVSSLNWPVVWESRKRFNQPRECEGTSSSFRHTAGEFLSQKIP